MSYVLLDDQIAQHPKILRAGAEAAWLWACAIAYCNRQLTDGDVPAEALVTLGTFRTPVRTLAETLVAVGLFDATETGYRVHDYLVHNPDRVTVQERKRASAERKAAYRARRGRPPQGPNGDGGVPLGHEECPTGTNEMSQWDKGGTGASSRAHVPTPTPTPTPTKRESASGDARPRPTLVQSRRRVAWAGSRKGLRVPQELHEEFLSKMAPPDEIALRAWYADIERAWRDRRVGDTCWKFWNARFAEWQGTTCAARVAGLAGGGTTPHASKYVAVQDFDCDGTGAYYRFHCDHTPTCTAWAQHKERNRADESRTA